MVWSQQSETMHRILITVLTRVPARAGLCAWCAPFLDELTLTARATGAPRQALPEEDLPAWRQLLAWADQLIDLHLGRLRFRLLDPATPLGLGYLIRRGIRQFPAFIFPDRTVVAGWDPKAVEDRVDALIGRPA